MTRFVPADSPSETSPFDSSPEGEAGGDRPEEIAAGFPRHLTRNLLEEASAEEPRRHAVQIALFVLALTLFALAQPQLGWFGRGLAWTETYRRMAVEQALIRPERSLQILESLKFLGSAILAALTLPILMSLGVRLGLSRGRALATALIGVLAPAAFFAARLPGPEARGLFAAALLFLLLAREARLRTLLAVVAIGFFLDPGTLVLLPAVFAEHGGKRNLGGKLGTVGTLGIAALVACVAWAWSVLENPTPQLFALFPAALVPGSSTTSAFLALHGLPALGLLLFFLPAPYFARRTENEETPPKWLFLWLAGALLSPFEGAPYLIPPAIFGLQDWLGRRSEASRNWLFPLLLGQFVLAIAVDAGIRQTDPLKGWRESASETLRAGDLILTDSEKSAHLLSVRGGYEILRVEDYTAGGVMNRLQSKGDAARRRWIADLSDEHWEELRSRLPKGTLRLRHP